MRMFWVSLVGLGFALISGLLGVPLWRGWIQSKLSQGTDRVYDITRTILIVGGTAIGIVGLVRIESEKELAAPWRLFPQQREQFVAVLSETPSRIEVDVVFGDPYSQDFAAELRALFTDAGWTVVFGGTRFSILEPTMYGIRVEVDLYILSDEDQDAREEPVLRRAFDAAGLDVPVEVYRTISPAPRKHISLLIGHSPLPPK